MKKTIRICDDYKRFKNIIIFGASTLGNVAYITLKVEKNIIAFCDNDSKKHGSFFCGVKVIPPTELLAYIDDCAVLIASMFHGAISYQLAELNIKNFFIFSSKGGGVFEPSCEYSIMNPFDVSVYKNISFSDEQRLANRTDFTNFLVDKDRKTNTNISTGVINYDKDKRKNVLFVAYAFPPLGGAGVQRSSKFVKYLKKLGYNPIVVAVLNTNLWDHLPIDETLLNDIDPSTSIIRIDDLYYRNESLTENETYEACAIIDGIIDDSCLMNGFIEDMKRYNHKNYRLNRFLTPWAANALRELDSLVDFSRVGVIYTSSDPYFDHFVGFYLKKKYNILLVIDFRDEWTNKPRTNHLQDSEVEKRLEKKVVEEADALISISRIAIKNFARICGVSIEKMYSITNGYDEDDFVLAGEGKSIGVFKNKLTVKYGGTLFLEHPGLVEFFKAINGLIEDCLIDKDNIEIIFNGNYTELIKEFVEKQDKHRVVKVLPYLEHIESIRNMLQADILLLFGGTDKSIYTGKVFEYIRMNVPIFALAPVGGLVEELLEKTKTGSCCANEDLEGIRNTFLKMYNDFFDGKKSHCPNYAEIEKYSRKVLTKKLIEVFEKLMP